MRTLLAQQFAALHSGLGARSSRQRSTVRRGGVVVTILLVGACATPTDADQAAPSGPQAVTPVSDCTLPAVPTAPTFQYSFDIPYYSPDGTPVTLDVAWPTAKPTGANRPIIAYVHGGAWREGSPHEYIEEMVRLAGQGYIAASIGYRLVPQARFPAPVADVSCAIRWLRIASGMIGADTTRILTIGASAGGQIVGLLATDRTTRYDASCPYVNQAGSTVVGAIGVSGAYDLTRTSDFSTTTNSEIAALLGGTQQSVPAVATAASPIAHVDAGDPPMLLLQGDKDDVVPVRQATQMLAALRTANVPSTLVTLAGVGHDISPLDTARARRTASCTSWSFIRERLGTPVL